MICELIALRAVFGQDEANHGTARYRVDAEGLVRVPPEAVDFLISKGGFALPKTSGAAAAQTRFGDAEAGGLVRLHHGDCAGCSYAGRQYQSDANGNVLVPAQAAAELMAHGFTPVPEGGSSDCPGPAPKPAGLGKPAAGSMPKPALRQTRG